MVVLTLSLPSALTFDPESKNDNSVQLLERARRTNLLLHLLERSGKTTLFVHLLERAGKTTLLA